MRRSGVRRFLLPMMLVLVGGVLSGCVDERIIYRDRALFEPVPAGGGEFVGYSRAAEKLTVCGNCHIDQQTAWRQTAHAVAWGRMQAVGGTQGACAACHGVSSMGNQVTTEAVGIVGTGDPRYQDVQCEACHGPGLEHVTNPARTVPLASLAAAIGANNTCTQCHSGVHHPFVSEWQQSGHANLIVAAAGRPECQSCHTGQDALVAFNVKGNYQERNSPTKLPITCGVCHDPHDGRFDGQLRLSHNVPDENTNLCMKCHHKRGGPEPTGNRGPHSPEGPMLLGEAGWWPPNMPIEPGTQIVGTHGSQANPRMCAGCHMEPYQQQDALTGQFTVSSSGHLFQAIPCLDEQGRPTRSRTCGIQQRTFRTCTGAGCHGSEAAARSATITARTRLDFLNAELKRLLALAPPSETNPNDNRYTTAEGSRFNSQLADRPGSVAHNPFLVEALLIGSINQMRRDYNLQAAADVSLELELGGGVH
jgi:predicted CXXCH cytochrome family protein